VSFGSRRNNIDDEQKTRRQRVGPQPKDAVPGDETVRVLQDFISGTEFNRIDFGNVTNLSWAAEGT
jgi:hypothetical protein